MIARRIFVLIDACLIFLAFALAHFLTPSLWRVRDAVAAFIMEAAPSFGRYFRPGPTTLVELSQLAWMLLVITPAVIVVLLAINAYDRLHDISRTRMLLSGPFAAIIGMSVAALLIFLLRIQEWSRVFLFTFTALMAVALTSVRAFICSYHHWQARNGHYRRNILLAGPAEMVQKVVASIGPRWPKSDFDVTGYLDSAEPGGAGERRVVGSVPQAAAMGFTAGSAVRYARAGAAPAVSAAVEASEATDTMPRRLGHVTEIEEILLQHPVHEVIAAPRTDGSFAWVPGIIRACDHAGISFRLAPEALLANSVANLVVMDDGSGLGKKVPSIMLAPRVFNEDALSVKRLIDLVLSVAALIVLAPVFPVLALLVRLSGPGPIFHPSKLVGQNGKRFVAWKFRTMVPNANALISSLMARNEMTGPVFKIRDDPRVTKIGRVLRKFSLDELPQLFSVVKGDQSLVGPRAASAHEFERYKFWQMRKISVKPGITCFWQVRGRNAISNFDDWIKMDLEYIDNWSLWLDFKILVRTVVVVVKGTGY
jgi:lipopolysaccharide/colanic/teichoic acid biosynthesis glycosyltransferase